MNMTNMPTISKVFIDTNVFVALKDDRDSTHQKAIILTNKFKNTYADFYTSSDVIGETLTVISQKLGKTQAIEFLKEIPFIAKEIFIDENIHKAARKLYRRVKSKNISFIDCSSAVAMKRNKIKVIFSFDEDFKSLGVNLAADFFQN